MLDAARRWPVEMEPRSGDTEATLGIQLNAMQEQQTTMQEQQETIGTKVASLEAKIEQQAVESSKRLDQLIKLVSAMQ